MLYALMQRMGRPVMTNVQFYDKLASAPPIDERNERPLLIALVAIVAAWSIAFLLAL
jgi:hypothetical protein